MIELTAHGDGSVMAVVAHAGAKRSGVLGERGGAVLVAVTAAPENGKANAAIERVLADCLRCKPAQVQLVSGATSRRKRFLILGMTAAELRERIEPVIARTNSAAGSG